jgi:hypothetical protein
MTQAPGPAAIPAAEESMHDPTDDPQFNESMYFNMADQSGSGFACLIRMGNRVNEGHAEVTVLVYLPDGSAPVHIERAAIADNAKFYAGGLRIAVVDPFERMTVSYAGDAHLLPRGQELIDPKAAFTTSPVVPMTIDLAFDTIGALYGMSGSDDGLDDEGLGGIEGAEDDISAGHYQGACAVSGSIVVAGAEYPVAATGFRDHSWGPRRWTAPSWWRWCSCIFDDSTAVIGWLTRVGNSRPPGNGAVIDDGRLHLIRGLNFRSSYGPEPYYPEHAEITVTTDEREYVVHCETLPNKIPLRHRSESYTARIAEVLGRFELEGRVGYGFMEYHDLLIDGIPAGMSEV